MTLRHALLATGAVLVLGLGVYLFVEVRSGPATAQASRGGAALRDPDPPAVEPASPAPSAPVAAASGTTIGRLAPPPADPPRGQPPAPAPELAVPAASSDPETKGYRLDAIMAEANKAYDRGDTEEAKAIAHKVLSKVPNNTRMLRVLVSSACIESNAAEAQKYYNQLPPADRETMRVRCARDHQITLVEPPPK